MSKYIVEGHVIVVKQVEVEAHNEREALKKGRSVMLQLNPEADSAEANHAYHANDGTGD